MKRLLATLAAACACLPIAACGGSDADLTIYSGRNEQLTGPLIERFQEETGLDVEVRYGDSAELAATIAEEGDNSPADVFFAQDAGSLGSIEDRLAPLPKAVLDAVPARFRDPKGRWAGTSARARVVAYSTERVKPGDLPDTILDYTDAAYRDKLGFAPPNASFQAFVTVLRLDLGDARAQSWLEQVKALNPKLYENNIQTVEAIARGEIDLGFVNHYYVYELKAERPDLPVANHFLRKGDPGAFVNAAGIGVLAGNDSEDAAQQFARFLVGKEAQEYFANKTFEYPVAAGVQPAEGLPPLDDVIGPEVALATLGPQLRPTLDMLGRLGLTS